MKRLNREYKLNVSKHVVVKYGSVNKDNPQVIYVCGKCWISPLFEMDYSSAMNDAETLLKKNIKSYLVDGINFDKKFIFDFNINIDSISIDNKNFLSFDLYLRQIERNKKSLSDLKELMNKKLSMIINSFTCFLNENGFSIQNKK